MPHPKLRLTQAQINALTVHFNMQNNPFDDKDVFDWIQNSTIEHINEVLILEGQNTI